MGDNVINACDQLASEVMHRVMRGDIEMTDQHYAAIRQHTKAVLIDWMLGDFKLKT